jgi:excisionase family DNA binding protein
MVAVRSAVVVPKEEAPQIREAARLLQEHEDAPVQLVLEGGTIVVLPGVVTQALRELVARLADGSEMAIGAFEGYTPEEAIYLLGASHSYIARVLESGELPYRLVGAEVRIAHADLMAHLAKLSELAHEGIREIQRISEELGMYDDW